MSRWWRSYADTHRNPKIARLSDADFRLWHQLLCVAAENDGIIPPLDDLKHVLNRRLDHLSKALERLVNGQLIDPLSNGYVPRNWGERQYKSDTSTERVRKHRAERNVSGNVSETPPDTDTDTEVLEAKAPNTVREVKSDPFPRPDFVDRQVWADFLANRRKKRLSNTPTAYKQFLADVARYSGDDWPPGRLVEFAAAKGWGGIYDPREQANGRTEHQSSGIGRTEAAAIAALGGPRPH